MEFNEGKIKPESNRKFLQNQVEEQSDVCDVTVKIGQWERKYHRCVLMTSPFFECILRNDFLEKHTGEINLNCGTPTNTDMTLMYMYGKKPQLDDTNIEDTIDLAEFFLIPNLKSACVYWLKRQTISEKNCLSLIQMSSKYGFELPACTEYLESHLNEVILQTLSLNLTYETIDYIFTEKRFCYFQMEDRLRFLVRWYEAQPDQRKVCTKKLLESIAFEDISLSYLNDIRTNKTVRDILPDVSVGLQDPHELTDVLITKTYEGLLCFDLAKDVWFKLQADATPNNGHSEIIVDTNPGCSELLIKSSYADSQLFRFSFETSEKETYQVVTNMGRPFPRSTCSDFRFNVCAICQLDRVKTNKPDETRFVGIDRLRLLCLIGHVEPSMLHVLSHRNYPYRDSTTVLIGQWSGEQVRVDPFFSISGCNITTVTVNKDSLVVLVPDKRTSLLIYDAVDCTMDRLDINTDNNDKVFPAMNGFVIHNNKRCIRIMRRAGPSLSQRYQVKEYVLGDETFVEKRYFYCNDTWFRFVRASYDTEYCFQCVEQCKIEEANSTDTVKWKELSLPKKTSANIGETMHFVRLPRRLLRCHVDCPHCKAMNQRSYVARRSAYYDDDNEYYYDDDDYNSYYYDSD